MIRRFPRVHPQGASFVKVPASGSCLFGALAVAFAVGRRQLVPTEWTRAYLEDLSLRTRQVFLKRLPGLIARGVRLSGLTIEDILAAETDRGPRGTGHGPHASEDDGLSPAMAAYVQRMQNPLAWGGFPEACVLAYMLSLTVLIVEEHTDGSLQAFVEQRGPDLS